MQSCLWLGVPKDGVVTRKAPLRAVTAEDAPAPKSLRSAAEVSERALLVMLRTKIAAELDAGVPPHTLAPLSRQLLIIAKEIEAIDLRAKEEGADAADAAPDEAWDSEAL